METSETHHRDLLSLTIDANHILVVLEQRAEELEELAVALAELVPRALLEAGRLDDGHVHLLASARRGTELRQQYRRTHPVRAVPDPPAGAAQ